MILASAQTKPIQGDIAGNLNEHYRLIKIASEKGVDLIVFPEMSITGYERENADKLSFSENDLRLDELRKLAVDNGLVIIAGAPIQINFNLYIGSFIFHPDSPISIYTKQFLHSGEEEFYKPSFDYNPIIEIDRERISLAICADIDHPLHPENANKTNSTIYISSIFFTPKGIAGAHALLSSYAKKYAMNVLMSNYSGKAWGLAAGGKSAFWSDTGELIAELDDHSSGLLIVEKKDGIWKGLTVKDKE